MTTFTISGLILASALSVGLMISCKEESSSKPTAPNIPVGPDWQTSENSSEMGFYSGKGDGQFGAYAGTNNEFQISVPAGDYVLEYTTQNTSTNSMQAVTTAGPFHVVFRASQPSILVIGLFSGVNINSNVSSASVSHGSVKTFSSSTSWTSNAVRLISWPGGGILSWLDAFTVNRSIAPVVLIRNGQVVSGVNTLPAPSQPVVRPTANPQPQPTATPGAGTPTATPTTPTPTPVPGTPTPTPTSENPCVVANANDSGAGSLRQLLTNAACPTITFASGVTKITLSGTQLNIERNVKIDGGSGVIIDGNNADRVFAIHVNVTVTIAGLTITGGKIGIHNNYGTLTLESSTTVSGNMQGGILNHETLVMNGTVSNNINEHGAGIYSTGTLIVNGTVSGNKGSGSGGGIYSAGTATINGTVNGNSTSFGGGIYVGGGTLTLNGTVSGNTAKWAGGGHGGGISVSSIGTLVLNGTVSNNTADEDGGGIENEGTLTLNAGHRIEGNHSDNNNGDGTGGGIKTNGACPSNTSYGSRNYRGSGTATIDNCNGNP